MRNRQIPVAVKLLYTAFCAVLIPIYLRDYGPTNFLYFCDVALLCALAAVWTESALLASAPAVGILVPQSLWMVDFLGTAAGLPVTRMTAYMFDPALPLFTRGLSFFHFWLPILLVWMVWRLGYDRRALPAWIAAVWILLPVSFFFLPQGPAPASNPGLPVNVNYVFGPDDASPQMWMPPLAWLGLLMVAIPAVVCAPTHWVLAKFAPAARTAHRG